MLVVQRRCHTAQFGLCVHIVSLQIFVEICFYGLPNCILSRLRVGGQLVSISDSSLSARFPFFILCVRERDLFLLVHNSVFMYIQC